MNQKVYNSIRCQFLSDSSTFILIRSMYCILQENPLLIECFDFNTNGNHVLIGYIYLHSSRHLCIAFPALSCTFVLHYDNVHQHSPLSTEKCRNPLQKLKPFTKVELVLISSHHLLHSGTMRRYSISPNFFICCCNLFSVLTYAHPDYEKSNFCRWICRETTV